VSSWTLRQAGPFRGEIAPPGDKSISHRAAILGALAEGETHITNFLPSEDCLNTVRSLRLMGIRIDEHSATELTVHGGDLCEPGTILDCGNSGTGLRLLAGVCAGQPFLSILTGDESIRRRPMKRICDPLRKMGATILARKGDLAPLAIRGGGLQGIEFESPVASAQVKSALLLAGLFAEGPTVVREPSLSRDHTERMLRSFGAQITCEELTVTLKPGARLGGQPVDVPGDISSAAFFIVGALICPGSELRVKNVGLNPTRTGLLDALRAMGADISVSDERELSGEPVGTLTVRHSALRAGEFGGSLIPRMVDEVPVLALAACFAEGETVIRDAQELAVKESDRLATVTSTLAAFGADVERTSDGMIIRGGASLTGAPVLSHGDHRIAMMAAVAARCIAGETQVQDVDCVNTSFPGFLPMLESVTR